MKVRKSEVAWDPEHWTRIEYLGDDGEPFYCCFEPRKCPEQVGDGRLPLASRSHLWIVRLILALIIAGSVAAVLAAR